MLRNLTFAFGAIAIVVSAVPHAAHAGGGSSPRTCAELESSSVTIFQPNVFEITAADGDVITMTVPLGGGTPLVMVSGFSNFIPPTSVEIGSTGAPSAGPVDYQVVGSTGDRVTFSCTVAEDTDHADQQGTGTTLAQRHFAQTQTDQVNETVMDALLGGGGTNDGGGVAAFAGNTADVSVSLEQLIRQQKSSRAIEQVALGYDSATGEVSNGMIMPYNAWVRGNYGNYSASEVDGGIFNLMAGADKRFSDRALLGIMVGVEDSDFDFDSGGSLEGNGVAVGIYGGLLLLPNLVVNASLSHGWLEYDNTTGGDKGSFDASRTIFSLSVAGQFEWRQFIIEPGASFFISKEDQDGYTTSGGTVVSQNDITLGRLSMGPKITLPIMLEGGQAIRLWVKTKTEYDFSSEDDIKSTKFASDDVLSSRIGAGIDAYLNDNVTISLSAEGHGLGGGEYTAVNVDGKVGVQF